MSIASEILRIKSAVHGDASISSGKGSVARSLEQTAKNWGIISSFQDVDDLAETFANITKYGTATASTANTITSQNGSYTIPAGYHTGNETVKASFPTTTADKTTLNCGDTATINAGYVNSKITITANSLASQTGVDTGKTAASAGQILSGYQAWVNGSKVTGTIANRGSGTSATLNGTTTSKKIAAGYWSSSNTVNVNTMDAPTITLKSSSQSISCKDKMMTGNITIPAVNFYYTGNTAPSSTTGYTNGDIFLVI